MLHRITDQSVDVQLGVVRENSAPAKRNESLDWGPMVEKANNKAASTKTSDLKLNTPDNRLALNKLHVGKTWQNPYSNIVSNDSLRTLLPRRQGTLSPLDYSLIRVFLTFVALVNLKTEQFHPLLTHSLVIHNQSITFINSLLMNRYA